MGKIMAKIATSSKKTSKFGEQNKIHHYQLKETLEQSFI